MVVGNLELREKLRFARFKPELLEPCDRGCNSPRAGERHRLDNLLCRRVCGAVAQLRLS